MFGRIDIIKWSFLLLPLFLVLRVTIIRCQSLLFIVRRCPHIIKTHVNPYCPFWGCVDGYSLYTYKTVEMDMRMGPMEALNIRSFGLRNREW